MTGFIIGVLVMAAIQLAIHRLQFEAKLVSGPGHTFDGCLTKTTYQRGDVIVSLGGRFWRLFRIDLGNEPIDERTDTEPQF